MIFTSILKLVIFFHKDIDLRRKNGSLRAGKKKKKIKREGEKRKYREKNEILEI